MNEVINDTLPDLDSLNLDEIFMFGYIADESIEEIKDNNQINEDISS